MNFQIHDSLIIGYDLAGNRADLINELLISQVLLNTAVYGLSYYNGVLTVKNAPKTATEAYVENGILKIR
jgi:hypothetical protein